MTNEVDPIDEATLGRLVRDVADDWNLPPRRLDAATWRDRVAPSDHSRTGRSRGRLGRWVGAGALAVALTVGLSLVAVWVSAPDGRTGIAAASPRSSSASASATSTSGPSATAFPKVLLNGDLPRPSSVLLRVGSGYAVADLATGSLGPPLDGATALSEVRHLADGTYACLCVTMDGDVNGSPTHAVVDLRRYDADGGLTATVGIGDYTGGLDPRPSARMDQPPNVDVAVRYAADGSLGYVGWSLRDGDRWKGGILIVDLETGAVTGRVGLPDVSIGPDDQPVNVMAAKVAVGPDGDVALVSRPTYSVEHASGAYHSGTEHYLMPASGRSQPTTTPFAVDRSCADGEADAGLTEGRLAWFLCWASDGGVLTVRRVPEDGGVLPDIQVDSTGEGGTWAVSGSSIYLWTPASRTIDRVDLVTGETSSGSAPPPTATDRSGPDPIGALGRWLAPSASAKVFLDPGIVVAPGTGSVVYALGIGTGDAAQPRSTGVFVFDRRTLEPLGHWAPTADFVSLAVSADGRFVYAAGASQAGIDIPQAMHGASVTVYDASDGSVRAIAGQLDPVDVQFTSPYLP